MLRYYRADRRILTSYVEESGETTVTLKITLETSPQPEPETVAILIEDIGREVFQLKMGLKSLSLPQETAFNTFLAGATEAERDVNYDAIVSDSHNSGSDSKEISTATLIIPVDNDDRSESAPLGFIGGGR